jgi:hypothetical protein
VAITTEDKTGQLPNSSSVYCAKEMSQCGAVIPIYLFGFESTGGMNEDFLY